MANGDIELVITLDDGSIVRGIGKAEAAAKQSGKNIENSFQKNIGGGFSLLSAQILSLGAAFAAAFAGRKVIAAAVESQNAINQLNQSLASAGTYSKAASDDMQAFAAQIQKTTTLGDDLVVQQLALARNFTKTNEDAKRLTQAAIELSAATGKDLDTSLTTLGKTLGGVAGRAAETIPSLKNLTKAQLESGAAIDIVLAKYGGSAASKVNTFSGAFDQLANVFNDLQETVGGFIVKSPGLVNAFKFISATLLGVTDSLTKLGQSNGDVLGTFLAKSVDIAQFFTSVFGPIIEVTINAIGVLARSLGALGAALVQLLSGEFKAAAATFREGVVGELFNYDTLLDTSATKTAETFLTGLNSAIVNAGPLTEELKNNVAAALVPDPTASQVAFDAFLQQNAIFVQQNKELFSQYVAETGLASEAQIQAIQDFSASSQQVLEAGLANAKVRVEQTKALMSQLRSTVATGIGSSFQSIGSALVKGENAFAAFGKAILGMFGDLAIQLGLFYLTLGLANLFLNPAAAVGQLAGGAALLVLGGALKAIGGGGGAAASAPSGGGGVSSGGGAGVPTDPLQMTPQLEERGPQIAVNIQGNILDRRQTGLEIADIIRESFDGNAVVFNT